MRIAQMTTHVRVAGAATGRPRAARGALPVLALAALLACDTDDILTAEDPDVLTPRTLNDSSALPTVLAGTIGNFQIAFSGGADLANGGHEGQINVTGLFTDELLSSETFPDRIGVDQRTVFPGNGSMGGVFLDLSRARAFAEFGSTRFNEFAPGTADHAEVLNLAGFTYVLFAENYCSGVPFSYLQDDGSVELGSPLTRDETLARAIAKFDSALTFAAAEEDEEQLHLASVGKARALLDLGQYAAAAAAVAAVPLDFEYVIESSDNSARQNNGVWNYTFNTAAFSVPDVEGANGLPFASADDPRVPSAPGGLGFDGTTDFTLQLKYPDRTTGAVLASGVEAQLMVAEAALAGGDAGAWLAALNAPRRSALAAPLPDLADPGDAAARVDLTFQERALWLYLTSHRLGDLRRLVRQYGRDAEAVFPTGEHHKGQYGTDVNLPISGTERNNPNFQQCLDRDA
jgi:starch-binding outer membrane protein, SusD/RagB family